MSREFFFRSLRVSRNRNSRTDRHRGYRRSLMVEPLEDRRLLAAVTVNNSNDVLNGDTSSIAALLASPGTDGISLREAVLAANAMPDADEVTFASGINSIALTATGEIRITSSVTITAPGADILTINGFAGNGGAGDGARIFNIGEMANPIQVTIEGITFSGGDSSENGGGILVNASDAASRVIIQDSVISGNSVTDANGGGIAVSVYQAYFKLQRSIISGNDATLAGVGGADDYGKGGGILATMSGNTGALIVEECSVYDNSSESDGGGIAVVSGATGNATVQILDSTFYNNTAGSYGEPHGGGGVDARGNTELINCTISGNRAQSGGGLLLIGDVKVRHSTITNNEAGPFGGEEEFSGGGGVLINTHSGGVYPSFDHSIIAGNTHNNNVPGDTPVPEYGYTPDIGFTFPQIDIGSWPDHLYYRIAFVPTISYTLRDVTEWPVVPEAAIQFDYTIVGNTSGPLIDPLWDPMTMSIDPDNNLVNGVGTGYMPGVNPMLDPLTGANGGFLLPDGTTIKTHALPPDSPAVDAGNPSYTAESPPPGIPYDQRGPNWVRVYDFIPGGSQIDIGALELQPEPPPCPPGDYNDDGTVNAADYTVWRDNLNSNVVLPNDLTPGVVDASDYEVWKEHFGETCEMAGHGMTAVAATKDLAGSSSQIDKGDARSSDAPAIGFMPTSFGMSEKTLASRFQSHRLGSQHAAPARSADMLILASLNRNIQEIRQHIEVIEAVYESLGESTRTEIGELEDSVIAWPLVTNNTLI